ncbi:MAG TPA: MOSC N-terminal beta barrel domain-containing protein [Ktedonobacterales bacterium]|nr:MOSC N-terminal beta barrel domain-containing protein [Ktedonobacterales bacterium]
MDMGEEIAGGEACGALAELWRYPVKSIRGEPIERATLGERGISGDRVYAVRDEETGKIASAKRPRLWGDLLYCHAALTAGPSAADTGAVQITLPDGRRVESGQEEASIALSALLARPVRLIAEAPPEPEIERYWPDIPGLDLRDTVTSGRIGAGAPRGTFFDFAPIHIVTTASLERMRALHPSGRVTTSRFRPNLVIAADESEGGWIENAWVGRTLLVGREARLRVLTPTPRCVVPTLPQPDAPRDLDILRVIAANNHPPIPMLEGKTQPSLGIYAVVERHGAIHRGDTVRLAPDA